MVFESLVADLLNKFLGDYVENLDSSQLKLGIWGGDVVLQNLDLKESALDDLELPVKVKAGHLGKLTLKIPWKNLYKEPVIATIDGVYALAVPNYAIKYDAVKEEKEKQEAKQKRLRQIEEAKMLEAEKNKPKEAKKDSFAEKMATQIIKNLQIHIKNIHVRYEDSYTNPKQPFAIGVTLQELLFQTTDENWKPCILKEAVTQIYKLVRLDSLAVYWNSKEKCMDGMERGKILESLKATIGTKDKKTDNQYLIKPLSFVSHLRLNTKPEEANFTIPKIYLTVVFDDIGVVLSKLQYNDVLEMLEALERMSLRGLYRKFRPSIEFKGHAKRWWHFARDCVMESVKRRRKMWSWSHIKRHRDTMKRYREAYTRKLEHKKTPSEVQKIIDECEEILDVFSITIMRQQAEVEAAKRGAKKQKEKEEKSWFGGWFGGGKKKDKGETTVEEIKDQFEELYTAEEKQKLYAAIDYEENEADPSLPKEYVAVKVVMKLSNMGFTLVDNSKQNPQLVKVVLQEMFASVSQRPAASAVALEAKMDKFLVRGVTQGGHIPKLVVSQNKQENETLSLLDIQVETNPLDGQCDTRVRLNSRPLQIVYDAVTINHLAEFFKPPDEVYLHQLSQAALAKLEDIKEQSATGLQHAIDIRKYTDIAIDIKSSYVIIPYGGLYKTDSKILVLDLGNLKVSSQKNEGGNQVKGQLDSVEEIMARAYDKFNINLESIQVLYSLPNQDWQKARQQSSSDMHVIEPIKIKLCLQKCMFSNDARMAKIKVSGELPILSVAVSDKRLQSLLSLVDSIPLPESAPPPKEDEYLKSSSDVQIIDMNSNELTTLAIGEGGEEVEETKKKKKDTTNYTDLELTFEVKQVMLKLSQVLGSEEVPVLKLVVESLGTQVKVCTYTLSVESYLGGVYLQYLKEKPCDQLLKQLTELKVMNDGPLINLVNTPVADEESFRLLTVQYLKADPKGPEFNTTYKKTEQSISVNFSVLEVLLHQEAILDLISLGKSLQPSQKPEPKDSTASQVHADGKKEGADKKEAPAVKKRKKKGDPDVVEVAIKAELSEFGVAICNSKTLITDARIKGAVASVMVQNDKTVVSTVLQAITVFNPDPDTIYPKIMEIQGSSVLDLQLTVYNDATEGDNYSNMDCVDTSVILRLGCIRVVYLNSFVMNLLSFLDNFQDAKDRMSEASEVVAEYSKDAVQKFQETAPRVKLDILMKAPVVEVPQNSRSRAVVLADFGELKILSHFQLAGKTSEAGVPAVLEKMDIKLTNLQLQRAVKSCKEDLGGQCLLVEPVTIAITVTRNLAASWYTEVPEVDVSGAMEAVMATMSQGDFTMIMTLLNENLGEGQPENKGQVQKPAGTAKDNSKTGADKESSSTTVTSDKVTTKVKASFEMKSLTAALYLGDNKLEGGSTVKRDPSKCLGKVEVLTIAVDAEVMSDTSIVTKVILQDTIVDDTRPQKEGGVTRMIERISAAQRNGQELTSNMIDVDFRQDNAQNKNVDVKISSIYICVCLDFLLSLSEVFKMPETDTTKPAITAKEEKPKGAKKEEQVPVEGSMVVKVTMDKPEIVLIEDQMNFESNALKLETAVMFRMRMSESGMEMSAEVGDLQVSSCVFNKRNVPGSLILCPCEISFYSKQPINQGAHMDLSTTELVVNISPASIRTFSAIVATLTAKPEEGTGTKKEKIPKDLWKTQSLKGSKFWFLQIEEATDGDDVGSPVDLLPVAEAEKTRSELLIAKIPSLVVKLEGGVGKRTVPLLILESSLSAEVKDWSCGLCVESSLFLEVAYYNENLTVWEPLIEPITDPNTGKRRMWSLNTDVKINEDALPEEDEGDMVDGETEVINKPLPKMAIKLQSQDALQVVITKTSLEVLTNLGKSFDEAYKGIEPLEKKGMVIAPYVINNHTGFEMVMKLDNTFELPEDATDKRTVVMSPERQLQLFNKKVAHLSRKASVIKATQEGEEKKVIFQIEQFNVTKTMTIKRAEKRLYHIGKKTDNDMWAVVMCTEAHIGQREVTLRSIVQMKNHLEIPMEIYYSDKKELCGVVSPGETLDLPLHCVYTAGGNFFFRPAHTESYQISSECVGWRAASNLGVKVITCANRQQEPTFYMNVSAEEESIYFEEGDSLMPKCYTFHLKPTVVLHNLFPFPIKYCLEGMGTAEELEKGDFKPLPYACVGRSVLEIILPEYQGKQWDAKKTIQADFPELSMWTFTSYTGAQKKEIDLGLHCKKLSGSLDLSFYCPYWMINKTGKTLLYKSSDDNIQYEHPYDVKDVVLFSFRQKTFMSSKKKHNDSHSVRSALAEPAYLVNTTVNPNETSQYQHKVQWKVCVTIGDTEWSDKFSLDVVGSSGTVQCKSSDRIFEVGLKIELTHNGLTKICTFTPYYMLLNMSEFSILFSETASQQQWMEVKAGECLPYWPEKTSKNMSMKAKVKDTDVGTTDFLFNKEHTTLMRLDNEFGGINVECRVTELSVVTTLNLYKHGMATVMIVNGTESEKVTFHQVGLDTKHEVPAGQYLMYTWDKPTGEREIKWSCGRQKDEKNTLIKDGFGDFFLDCDSKVYWVSFLDGMQRVLFFTEDIALNVNAQQAGEVERIEQEITVGIQGLGLSLINDLTQREVAFLGITSSGIIWEEKRKRYKALSCKATQQLEEAYQRYLLEIEAGHKPPAKLNVDKMEVSFGEMMMFKPNTRKIQRSFRDGIWLQYQTSPHQVRLHAMVNKLQLDNQAPGAVFPTVISGVPLPKSVAAESVPKPFAEASILIRQHEHSQMKQFKYFKVLIQEMAAKLDQGFLNNIIDLFTSDKELTRDQEVTLLKKDYDTVDLKLIDVVGLSLAEEQKNFFDYLHFSPIKVHLSFSMQGGEKGKAMALHANIINVFLQSVGVVLTDVQDVIFKLGYFQREHVFLNQSELTSEMTRHFANQAIKQMYVLVLGLDVLGNPFGLLRGTAEGIKDLFYEPYQGAIQGPEEFAEGLALGVKSLLGHAVGGAAGAVSRITGTVGKGLAVLTLDDDYQKRRREALNKRPATAGEGFARGGKNLVMGVFDGVTGIVRKPIEGARSEGVEGFFKGVGKGLIGVVTRPTSGVIDFASSSFEGIKRIADMAEEIKRLRPPRHFHSDRIIRPYNLQESEGYAILSDTEKGKFLPTDHYYAHVVTSRDGRSVLIVTDKRVMLSHRGEIFGQWDADWTYTWMEMKEPPKRTSKGIEIHLKEKEKKKFLFGSSTAKKEVPIADPKSADYIVKSINEVMSKMK